MNNELQVFSYKGNKPVRIVEVDGEPWFVAKDVCDILGYVNVTDTLNNHLDEDERSTLAIREGTSPKGGNPNMNIINESGLYALILRSNMPKAKDFRKWVTGTVLPSIRKIGTYSLTPARPTQEEIEIRRKELDIRESEVNLRRATLIRDILYNPPFPVTPETQTVFAHEVFKLTTGHSYLAMLPDCTEKWYTATEIGNELGISANKVGRIAKANGIKAPEGESNEYGRWIYSKSQHSSREVPSFIYNEDALEWFRQYQRENAQ